MNVSYTHKNDIRHTLLPTHHYEFLRIHILQKKTSELLPAASVVHLGNTGWVEIIRRVMQYTLPGHRFRNVSCFVHKPLRQPRFHGGRDTVKPHNVSCPDLIKQFFASPSHPQPPTPESTSFCYYHVLTQQPWFFQEASIIFTVLSVLLIITAI